MSTYAHYINTGFRQVTKDKTYEAESLQEACYMADAGDQDAIVDLATGQAYAIYAGYCEDCENEIEYDLTPVDLNKG